MAQLKFSGLQPVEFNGRDCTPQIDTGRRLRLSRLNFNSEADIKNANEILASCFPNDEDFVLDFLTNKMLPTDKRILASYLLNGEKAIAMLDRTSDAYAEKMVNKMVEEATLEEKKDE